MKVLDMSDDTIGAILAALFVGVILGSAVGVALATERQHSWALEAGAAYYDDKTGEFHYGIPTKKQD